MRCLNARNIVEGVREEDTANLRDWFGGDRSLEILEQVIGLGTYGNTLTVITCNTFADEDDKKDELEESWTPRWR
jgi:hypothetical protein